MAASMPDHRPMLKHLAKEGSYQIYSPTLLQNNAVIQAEWRKRVLRYQDGLDETVNKLKFGDEGAAAVTKPSGRNKIAMLTMLDINQAVSKSFFQAKKRRSTDMPLEPRQKCEK